MQIKKKKIWGVGNLYIQRSEQFQLKKVVSDFVEHLIVFSAKNAAKHVSMVEYATFCYGELQMHSIIVPALAKLTDCFILEYPIKRGDLANRGRVDYYCANRVDEHNEYRLFLELKCGRQGIPMRNNKFRKRNIDLWNEVNKQLDGILQEIKQEKDFYDKNIVRVCMEIITLYTDDSKNDNINSDTLQDVLKTSIDALKYNGEALPNISVLWEFHANIVDKATDDYNSKRKFRGLLFLCRVLPPITPNN